MSTYCESCDRPVRYEDRDAVQWPGGAVLYVCPACAASAAQDEQDVADVEDNMTRKDAIAELTAIVGDDGNGDIGVIVDNADAEDTIDDLVSVVRQARADFATEKEAK